MLIQYINISENNMTKSFKSTHNSVADIIGQYLDFTFSVMLKHNTANIYILYFKTNKSTFCLHTVNKRPIGNNIIRFYNSYKSYFSSEVIKPHK